MSEKKEFTGVFTPKAVFKLPLTWFQKYVFSSIIYLDNEDGCTASNVKLAEKLESNKEQVSKAIKAIEKAGLITSKKTGPKNNQRRTIRVVKKTFHKMTKQHLENVKKEFSQCQTDISQNVKMTTNIKVDNNKVNSKVDSEEKPTQKNTNPNISLNDEKDSKKKKSEAAKKEKEPQFGGGRPMTFIYFDIMKDKRPDMFPEKPMEGHLIDLKRIIKSVEAFIRDQKQKAGLPAFNVSKKDLEDNFRVFVDNLPKRILDKHFSTSSIARNIHGYLYEMHAGKLKDNSKGTHDELLAMKEAIRQKRELRKQNHKL